MSIETFLHFLLPIDLHKTDRNDSYLHSLATHCFRPSSSFSFSSSICPSSSLSSSSSICASYSCCYSFSFSSSSSSSSSSYPVAHPVLFILPSFTFPRRHSYARPCRKYLGGHLRSAPLYFLYILSSLHQSEAVYA